MSEWKITPEAVKMAWKMLLTIFPRYSVPARDRNALLTIVTVVAIDDLRGSDTITWKQDPPAKTILVFDAKSVALRSAEKTRIVLKKNPTSSEIERGLEWAEQLFDRFNLTEEERATLFTALPCVGLHALEPYIRWEKEPPFAELG